MVQREVKNLLHYLDDFVFVSKTLSLAKANMQVLVDTFECLGVPLEPSKLEGPATSLLFLGIEVDTIKLQIRLPSDKLAYLKEKLADAVTRKCMSKQSLQSFIRHIRPPRRNILLSVKALI